MTIENIYVLFIASAGIATDTRSNCQNRLFFALSGPNFDANQFAHKALDQGAMAVVVDDKKVATDDRFVVVEDALEALQGLSNYHRNQLTCPVIAICGSNGKTTSKELIAAVLSSHYPIFFTPGNFNNHIGVPLSLLQITDQHQYAIIEMGANHKGEHEFLCNIAEPDYGVITNNGKDHLEGFGSIEGVIEANNELFEYLRNDQKKAFVNNEDEILMQNSEGIERILYGDSEGANCKVVLKEAFPFTSVEINFKDQSEAVPVKSQLFGSFQKDNMALAACMGDHFEVPHHKIKEALEGYQPANMRTQQLKWKGNDILLDAYNANPSSMMAVLSDFAESSIPKKGLILGDMLEMGDASEEEHAELVAYIAQQNFEWVALVGKEFARHQREGFHYFETAAEVRESIIESNMMNFTLLIKGSRGLQLEKVIEE